MGTQALSQTLETEKLEEGRLSERSVWTKSNRDLLSFLREVASFSVFSSHLTLSLFLYLFTLFVGGHQMGR